MYTAYCLLLPEGFLSFGEKFSVLFFKFIARKVRKVWIRKVLKLCGVWVFLLSGLYVKLFWLVQVRNHRFFYPKKKHNIPKMGILVVNDLAKTGKVLLK